MQHQVSFGTGQGQSRALDNPHVLFGLLWAAEMGRDLRGIAEKFNLLPETLEEKLEQARNGEGPRALAFVGRDLALPSTRACAENHRAESARAGGRPEVLLERWKRRMVRHLLCRPLTAAAAQPLVEGSDVHGGLYVAMRMLETELGELGFQVFRTGQAGELEFTLDDIDAKKLGAVVRNGWVMAP